MNQESISIDRTADISTARSGNQLSPSFLSGPKFIRRIEAPSLLQPNKAEILNRQNEMSVQFGLTTNLT
jgi:hypothetical protein